LKRIIAFLACVFLLSSIVSSINATETRLIWNLGEWEGLDVKIYAPWQAYPNDNMTVRIIVEAMENLTDVTVRFKIYGSESEGFVTWYYPIDVLKGVRDLLLKGSVEDQYFNVSIPESVDPGLLHALVTCSWKVWRESSWQERSIDDWIIHRVTYLRNKPYEDLQVAYSQLLADYSLLLSNYTTLQANYEILQTHYSQLLVDYDFLQTSHSDLENSYTNLQANYSALQTNYDELLAYYNSTQNDYSNLQTSYGSLNSTYYSLLSNYSSLQARFNELKSKYEFGGEIANTLNLMYVFIETTVIFIATTVYFIYTGIYSGRRKPKN